MLNFFPPHYPLKECSEPAVLVQFNLNLYSHTSIKNYNKCDRAFPPLFPQWSPPIYKAKVPIWSPLSSYNEGWGTEYKGLINTLNSRGLDSPWGPKGLREAKLGPSWERQMGCFCPGVGLLTARSCEGC
ncbi:hypothetical protein CDAR_81711 [Caerostris darwini]|uniref:Uncharacterized protein n=1 Tax=Caerostris darwini TaxID=1538125 RepID=A0AAV4WHF2_9ARAC|nr:hypothetical protein CDAR_81711 [Caerostris darwini]